MAALCRLLPPTDIPIGIPEHTVDYSPYPSAAWLKFRAGTLTYLGMLEGNAKTQEELP